MLAVIHGGQIVQSIRIVRLERKGLLVVLAGLIEREHVMVGDTDLVPDDCGSIGLPLVGIDCGRIAAVDHQQVSFNLGRESRSGGSDIRGRWIRVRCFSKRGGHTRHERKSKQQSEAGGPATMKVTHFASFPDDRVSWTRN